MDYEKEMKQQLGNNLTEDDKEVLQISKEFEEESNKILAWL